MLAGQRLKIAVQKSGRLNASSLNFLKTMGLNWSSQPGQLSLSVENFPLDIMTVRDDDIPKLVGSGVCDFGILGKNLVEESACSQLGLTETLCELDFAYCRLSIALPDSKPFTSLKDLNGMKIASSYPRSLESFLEANKIRAESVYLNGTVEIAPKLGIADAICDLVSSGNTLRANGLREVLKIYDSQALLVKTRRRQNSMLASISNTFLEQVGVLSCQ